MVNSGRCSSLRSRSRNTRASSNILVSPAASNFLQENSGEVRKYRVARSPPLPKSSVRGACRWVSLPGETCKIPVSTSAKPCSSNHALIALVMALRAAKNGLMSACRAGDHHRHGGARSFISPDKKVRVEQYSNDLKDWRVLYQFWTFDADHRHAFLLNPGEDDDVAGYAAGFRFSPDSQWLVRM